MTQLKLTAPQRRAAESAAICLRDMIEWGTLGCGESYWKEAHDRLQRMYRYGTTDGKPWVEPVEPQSVDSSLPEFVMPADWHGRIVVATAIDGDIYEGCTIVGIDHDAGMDRYAVRDRNGFRWWAKHVRFCNTDGDTCDWSDDDTAEPC